MNLLTLTGFIITTGCVNTAWFPVRLLITTYDPAQYSACCTQSKSVADEVLYIACSLDKYLHLQAALPVFLSKIQFKYQIHFNN